MARFRLVKNSSNSRVWMDRSPFLMIFRPAAFPVKFSAVPSSWALVVDTNILASTVRTRLILEEPSEENDNEEKLSTEFYTYDKEEIRRQSKKNTGRKGKDKARNSEKAKK